MADKYHSLRISSTAHKNLIALSGLTNRSMNRLIEILSDHWLRQWKQRMKPDEFARLLKDDVSFAEAGKIRERFRKEEIAHEENFQPKLSEMFQLETEPRN
jgi:hypothetical protein